MSLDQLLDDESDLEPMDPTIQNILDQKSLKWIFVGGKGGVGKTTSSSCIAIQLAKVRESVLLISTDPAHNLSDAFSQKFGKKPTLVKGYKNLHAMEIDPNLNPEEFLGGSDNGFLGGGDHDTLKNMIKDIAGSLPGMDEITGFLEILKQVQKMEYSVVVFDTAPTGHTLRLLSLPSTMEKGMGKMSKMVNMGGLMQNMSGMFGGGESSSGEGSKFNIGEKMESTKKLINSVTKQFKDPKLCTFVCVCIPEFLSVYETERLVQELTKYGIDSHNIVVNQIVFKPKKNDCEICESRTRIQQKYMKQIFSLYEDFHVIQMPLVGKEVRGVDSLLSFGKYLTDPYPEIFSKEESKKNEKEEKK